MHRSSSALHTSPTNLVRRPLPSTLHARQTHLYQINLPILQFTFPIPRRSLPELLVHRAVTTLLRSCFRAGRRCRRRRRALELLQEVRKVLLQFERRERMRVLLLGLYMTLSRTGERLAPESSSVSAEIDSLETTYLQAIAAFQ